MFGLGIGEIIIILVIVFIIFGAGKLPEIGAALGEGIRNFKAGVSGPHKEQEKPIKTIEAEKEDKEKMIPMK